ncbi:hypothetical protein LTR37_000628 [Vermiconidia calcicola]|uniref:Uncharacterized protein n=1 Tax=Vermiconidia calcicola TaxID=1690605 RepID=A0ACC3NYQ1_9PEZI|nr:hypothetical protein LTR37_000628 [Vermiconidia calcicola]
MYAIISLLAVVALAALRPQNYNGYSLTSAPNQLSFTDRVLKLSRNDGRKRLPSFLTRTGTIILMRP